MRRIIWCLRINSIISRIPVRLISTWECQGHIYQRAVPAVGHWHWKLVSMILTL